MALRAGVSVATVSNVFNRPAIVAPQTRKRVESAVRELGYVRNESARQLRRGRSRTIGLVVPDIANPFFTDVARGVEDSVSAVGAMVIVGNSDDDADKEQRYLTLLAEQQVMGALVVPVRGSQAVSTLLRKRGIPVVVLDIPDDGSAPSCSVSVNDVAGGRIAVAHLLAEGHRRIGFVGSDSAAPQAVERAAGARLALSRAGRSPNSLVRLAAGSLNVEGGAAAARQLLAMPAGRRPTALACVNDLLALGVLRELMRAGVRVPADVAIVGYDDIGFAEAAAVPLSSVRQPSHLLGQRAVQLLLEECSGGPHQHSRVVFEPELVVRASSSGGTTAVTPTG